MKTAGKIARKTVGVSQQDCWDDYKAAGKPGGLTRKKFLELRDSVAQKIKSRKRRAVGTGADPLADTDRHWGLLRLRRNRKIEAALERQFRFLTVYNQGFSLIESDEVGVQVTSETDWDYYGRRSQYPKVWTSATVSLPLAKMRRLVSLGRLVYDGIVNCAVHSHRTITVAGREVEVLRANWLVQSHRQLYVCMGYIASSGEIAYHSTESARAALRGLDRKIKRAQRPGRDVVLPDERITPERYAKLTGACLVGVYDWMRARDIEADSLPAEQVADLLAQDDFGRAIFLAALKRGQEFVA